MGTSQCFGTIIDEERPSVDINSYVNSLKEKKNKNISGSKDKKHSIPNEEFDYFASTYDNTHTSYASTCRTLKNTIDSMVMTGGFGHSLIEYHQEEQQQENLFMTATSHFRNSKFSLKVDNIKIKRKSKINRSKSNDFLMD